MNAIIDKRIEDWSERLPIGLVVLATAAFIVGGSVIVWVFPPLT